MKTSLFGEKYVTQQNLIESFMKYVSEEESQCLKNMLEDYSEDGEEELIDLLDGYKCYTKPSKDNLKNLIFELANQEIVQKPRYIANAFATVFKRCKDLRFDTIQQLDDFYEAKRVTNRKVIKSLICDPSGELERNILSHLKRFIKSMSKDDLSLFLRFVTGGDVIIEKMIQVVFNEMKPRAPRARTCVPQPEINTSYSDYNEFAEEYMKVLRNPESFHFYIS